jgi:hypothetical protein
MGWIFQHIGKGFYVPDVQVGRAVFFITGLLVLIDGGIKNLIVVSKIFSSIKKSLL